jgi:hypothetical protein
MRRASQTRTAGPSRGLPAGPASPPTRVPRRSASAAG